MYNSQNPLVSIIILDWNGERHIHRCVEHVVQQTYKNIEVIIVDNHSTDGSFEKIKTEYPHFIYIQNEDNLGFAVGMNQGIKMAQGQYIVALNQDVCLHHDFISECVHRMFQKNAEKIGAIGGRVYSWTNDQLTDELRPGEGERAYMRKCFQVIGGIWSEKEAFVLSPTGTSTFFRKEMLKDIYETTGDYYDELFVTGWEDLDLFLRMQLLGWSCLFLPSAILWHVGSGSVGGKSTLISKPLSYQARALRNRYYTMIKNLPGPIILWLFPFLMITELGLLPYFMLRAPKTMFALLYARFQTMISFPKILKKRIRIQRNLRTPPYYLKQFFVSF